MADQKSSEEQSEGSSEKKRTSQKQQASKSSASRSKSSTSSGTDKTQRRKSTSAASKQSSNGDESSGKDDASPQRKRKQLSAGKAASEALRQLAELTTRSLESVVGVEPDEDGWRVTVEVVESARIPDTADIMAEYEVVLDRNGRMSSYVRGARYARGRAPSSD